MNEELIVQVNKDVLRNGILYMPLIISAYLLCYFILRNILGYYFLLLLQGILIIFISFFLISLPFAFFEIKNNDPAAIINKDGIWVKYFNLIPWSNIGEVDNYYVQNSPFVYINITVKDISQLSQKTSLLGKCAIFWSKITKCPPVIITNITLDNEIVINFAKKFMQ